jgi:hypothetical protein
VHHLHYVYSIRARVGFSSFWVYRPLTKIITGCASLEKANKKGRIVWNIPVYLVHAHTYACSLIYFYPVFVGSLLLARSCDKRRAKSLSLLILERKVQYGMMSTFAAPFIVLSPYVFANGLVGAAITAESNVTFTASNAVGTPDPRQGWTAEPNGRGTLSILWSCGFTMFLCSWSILCLNVPGPNDTRFRVFRRKLYVTTLSFLGPEFIFQIALGQWISARHSVRDFRASFGDKDWISARQSDRDFRVSFGDNDWTMRHAFFADMGGFKLRTADPDPLTFPIDAKQLHYLVTEGHVVFPKLNPQMIEDRNKANGALRIITLFQILWFLINVCGRAAQQLTITCLELTTAAFIVCSVGTLFCWFQKPSDVVTAEILPSTKTLAEILEKESGQINQQYSKTPLDFISRKEWPWSLYWSNWINILRNLGIVFAPSAHPVDRFENTIARELPGATVWVFLGVTAAYSAIFICGWGYSFPTATEQLLWRIASITMMGCLIAYWAVTQFAFEIYPAIQQHISTLVVSHSRRRDPEQNTRRSQWPCYEHLSRRAKYVAACVRNNSVDQDPVLNVPLKAILPIYVVAFFYCSARTYLFIADAIELRSLPATAYATVNWTVYFPHF